jgi:fructosamine-3-kinase
MAPGPGDPLAAWLMDRCGVSLAGRTAVGGGCIHSAWCLELRDGGRLFAKTNRADALPLLEAEAEGLAALAAAADPDRLVIPVPLALGVVGDQAVLLLPWLELGGSAPAARWGDGGGWRGLGAALAELHRRSLATASEGFGWHHDNFIGSGPQPNRWQAHWGTFFAERRLQPQLQRLAARSGPLRGGEELLEQVPAWLGGHGAEPCLVHGDLWSGNAALTASGSGALFDPAVYRGDREVDLAMARLFGGFPEAFFAGYEQAWPLPAGHRARAGLYNLYHLLNHANLFGGGYRQQAQAAIDQLLSRLC